MTRWTYLLAVPLAFGPIAPPVAVAQQAPPAQTQVAAPAYTQAELEQILAPIALYPDDLLTQVLVASTYPLEVVMANRWVEQPSNKALKDDALLKALDGQDWDASVKSLVPFPTVLKTMSEQLDWTQKLGDAFLAQQSDVFAAVQALRGRAQTAGTLQSNAQQTVTQDASAIIIQPAQADTVYVPAYNPTVVYGAWPYPSYPPAYYPPPPGYYVGSALATGLAFGAGIAITGALWGWGRPNWGAGNVNVNVNRFNSINVKVGQHRGDDVRRQPGRRDLSERSRANDANDRQGDGPVRSGHDMAEDRCASADRWGSRRGQWRRLNDPNSLVRLVQRVWTAPEPLAVGRNANVWVSCHSARTPRRNRSCCHMGIARFPRICTPDCDEQPEIRPTESVAAGDLPHGAHCELGPTVTTFAYLNCYTTTSDYVPPAMPGCGG